jgi:hypothetical protein
MLYSFNVVAKHCAISGMDAGSFTDEAIEFNEFT